jgi:pyruvate ferredoxin oxidoreductase beta subunit
MPTLKELAKMPDRITAGHRLCPGCGAPIAVRQILRGTDKPVAVVCATGCLEVATTIYPHSAWKCPYFHNAFENAAATLSGIETAYRALKKKGKIKKDIKFVAFGGDGGTYDIGLQSLSGAMERGHDIVYVCYDNEAYMNTGIQRSSATPFGAATTTSNAGKVHQGKEEFKKNLLDVVAAHEIPYAAQTSISEWNDVVTKAKKAFETKGPAFINIIAPCQRGWRHPHNITVQIAKLAVETRFWPLLEIENGRKWTLNRDIKNPKPITEWLKPQGRFKHLFKPGNEQLLEKIQQRVNSEWERIKKLCECSGQKFD